MVGVEEVGNFSVDHVCVRSIAVLKIEEQKFDKPILL